MDRNRTNLDSSVGASPQRTGLLGSIDAVFEQNRQEDERRKSKLRDQREAELAHSSYLKYNASSVQELQDAKCVVQQWANKHSSKRMNNLTKAVADKRSPLNRPDKRSPLNRPIIKTTNSRFGTLLYSTQNNGTNSMTKPNLNDKRSPLKRKKDFIPEFSDDDDDILMMSLSDSGFPCVDLQTPDRMDISPARKGMKKDTFGSQLETKRRCFEPSIKVDQQSKNSEPSHTLSSAADFIPLNRNNSALGKEGQNVNSEEKENNLRNVQPNSSNVSVVEISDEENSVLHISDHDLSSTDNSNDASNSIVQSVRPKDSSLVRCPVLNCNGIFDSKEFFDRHMNNFEHSPTDPWGEHSDNKDVPSDIVMCPECGKVFKQREACEQHIKDKKHVYPLTPLPVQGYLCRSCLMLFPTDEECVTHITTLKHNSTAFPFSDDMKGLFTKFKGIPVSKKFVEDYYKMCMLADFNIVCCDCEIPINGHRELQQHLDETRLTHSFMALTEMTLMDIFTCYLYTHKCSTCHAAVENPKINGGFHSCNKEIAGKIITDGCSSFKALVLGHCVRLEQDNITELKIKISETSNKEVREEPMELDLQNVRTNMTKLQKCEKVLPSNQLAYSCVNPGPSNDLSYLCEKPGPSDNSKSFKRKSDEKFTNQAKNNEIEDDSKSNKPSKRKKKKKYSGETETSFRMDVALSDYSSITDPAYLKTMANIIFLDLDNWRGFFPKLPNRLPERFFVWAFYGGNTHWSEPYQCGAYEYQVRENRFYLHDRCGTRKDAADFAICLTVGQMDMVLPPTVHFTILSGDKGFMEIERQMKGCKRKAVVIDPHEAMKMSSHVLYTMLVSVGQT
ncbi:E3 SUMO-protein ligase ZNF451-like isoform X2 [Mytilus trossulus]|uniref:E3 SUMO-protein ligase ZNF451-like isoform X2 n=1 Tax=Mytilus trossulus TaxID=6551 RepID=UPI0030066A6A